MARFAGRGAGEVGIGPEEPGADLLVIGEGGVGGGDGLGGGLVWIGCSGI